MAKNQTESVINENQIRKILNNGKIGGLYFIFGNESYLKIHYANMIASKAVKKDFEDFNLHKIDGKVTTIDKIAEAVEAMPMLSENTCVIVNDLPIYELDDSEIEKLIALMTNPPDTCAFVLLMDTVEKKLKKEKKTNRHELDSDDESESGSDQDSDLDSDSRTETLSAEDGQKGMNAWDELLAAAIANGYAVELNKRSNAELEEMIIKGAEKRGRRIEKSAAHFLVENVGNDLSNLQNELDKVCAFTANQTITQSDIDTIAIKSIEVKVFDMVKLLLNNNFTSACLMLDAMLPESLPTKKAMAIQIMGALISPFIDMYRAKVASAAGFQATGIAKYYNYKNKEFRLTHAARDATNFSIRQLRDCLDLLDEADALLKSVSVSPKLIIEQTMIRILKAAKQTLPDNKNR